MMLATGHTGGWWGVESDLGAEGAADAVPVGTDPEGVHAVIVQVGDHHIGAIDAFAALPASCLFTALASDHLAVPQLLPVRRGRVARKLPADQALVVDTALGPVDDGGLGHWRGETCLSNAPEALKRRSHIHMMGGGAHRNMPCASQAANIK